MRLLYKKDIFYSPNKLTGEIKEVLIRDLQLEKLADLLAPEGGIGKKAADLLDLMTCDPEEISYRQELCKDLFENDDLFNDLKKMYILLLGLNEIVGDKISVNRKEISNYLITINWLNLFCSIIIKFNEFFHKYKDIIKSEAFKKLGNITREIHKAEEFKVLSKNIKTLSIDNHTLSSVRLGINLDDYLEPVSVNCLEINNFYYNPRKIVDLKSKKDNKVYGIGKYKYIPAGRNSKIGGYSGDYEAIKSQAVLVNTTKIQRVVSCEIDVQFIQGLDYFLKMLNFNNRRIMKKFISKRAAEIIELTNDLGFFLGGVGLARKLSEKDMPVCLAEICDIKKHSLQVKGLYNCYLPFLLENPAEKIVSNDINFLKGNVFSILNGPNKGGKTTFIQALAINTILFQLGLYSTCENALISPFDKILTHYQRDEASDRTGRLVMEAESMKLIFSNVTEDSLIILNEPYVSTSPAEGMFLIMNSLTAIMKLGCRGILVTHYHKLNDEVEEKNKNSENKISFLNMGIEGNNGRRTFKLIRGRGAVKSYAMDILREYAPGLID